MSKAHNVKFYNPVWEKLKDAPNKNMRVNVSVGKDYGIPLDIILSEARNKGDTLEDVPVSLHGVRKDDQGRRRYSMMMIDGEFRMVPDADGYWMPAEDCPTC